MSRRTADLTRDDYWEWIPVQPVPDPDNFWTDEEKDFIEWLKANQNMTKAS